MNKLYWIWLQCALGVGNAAGDVIVKEQLSPAMLYLSSEEELLAQDILPKGLIRKLKNCPIDKAKTILRKCEALKIWLICPEDRDYPENLRHIYQIPLVLYGIGDRSLLSKGPLITMVGSRKATINGCNSARSLAKELAELDFGIVSGLALGIDSYSHQGALDAGGITIGVAGCSLDTDYPKANHDLRRNIARKGVIISEFAPGEKLRSDNFPIRNRILSGLSVGTIVVEAAAISGSLVTAELALQQGRDVFALPTDLYNKFGAGNLKLIGEGATIVLSAQTIAEEYSHRYGDKLSIGTAQKQEIIPEETNSEDIQLENTAEENLLKDFPKINISPKHEAAPEIPEDLSEAAKSVLRCVGTNKLPAEEISLTCNISMQELLVILTELEIDGLVKAYPGKIFGR